MAARWLLITFASLALVGCGSEETASAPPPPSGCADPLELALPDGSCLRPGVAPDGCAPGFLHDGEYGCEPVLPAEPCPVGLIAVPGDTACRPVMPCGEGTWGDISVEPSSQYVDQSYAGTDSDGSASRPWTTIGDAVAAAAPGAIVAIARGSYPENVVIRNKQVRLWGVCPDEVAIVATTEQGFCPPAAVCIVSGAHGAEVRGLALSGAGIGVVLSGAEGVLVARVRVHDNAGRGINAQADLGATSLTVRGSLVEQNREFGLFIMGSDATVETSTVRTTVPRASDEARGRGISIQPSCTQTSSGLVCDAAARGRITVTGSLIEQNHEMGLFAMGSDATVEGSVVRTTSPRAADQGVGIGLCFQVLCGQTPSGPTCDPAGRSLATLSASLVEENHDLGLFVMGSDVTVERSVVRRTLPRASDQVAGRGIQAQVLCLGTYPMLACDAAMGATATLTGSLIEENHDVGLFVGSSDVSVSASVVRATLPRAADGLFGDAIVALAYVSPAAIDVSSTLVDDSARAGVASFGASVSVGSTYVRCAAFELTGEAYGGQDFVFDDRGDNHCGCPLADGACKAVSVGLEPPEPLGGD